MLKNLILSNYFSYILYLNFCLFKSRLFLSSKASKLHTRRILNQTDLVQIVAHAKEEHSDVCHIIGSGWSLSKSLTKVVPDDYVIGFNYSGLCDLCFDLYIAEFGGFSVSNASFDHLKIANELSRRDNSLIIFKNIWEVKNDIDFLNQYWVDVAWFVRDRLFPLPNHNHLRKALDLMLNDQSTCFPQCVSSVIFAVLLAYKSGFKSVVVHGVDFGGCYFYECDDFIPSVPVLPSVKSQSGFYGSSTGRAAHPTSLGRIGLQDLLSELNYIFVNNNCRLLCGTQLSPSSQILSVYSP